MTSFDIDTSAPATARADTFIEAPAARVWARLSHLPSWPLWSTQVEWISALIPHEAGARFELRAAGQTVQARIQGVEPNRSLCWTGTGLFVSIRVVLTVEDHGSRCRVLAAVSYRGAWPIAFPKRARRQAKAMMQQGLTDLKAAIEGKPLQRKAA